VALTKREEGVGMPAVLTGRQGGPAVAKKRKRITFADRLRTARDAAGISQYRLAKLSGLSKQAVNLLESGQVPNPSWETVQALARALGVTTEAFLTDPPANP
jgi:DNA-binding XRE family transcriptional regulator